MRVRATKEEENLSTMMLPEALDRIDELHHTALRACLEIVAIGNGLYRAGVDSGSLACCTRSRMVENLIGCLEMFRGYVPEDVKVTPVADVDYPWEYDSQKIKAQRLAKRAEAVLQDRH